MPNSETLIDVVDLSLSFGGVLSMNAVSMTVGRGELLALIGPNGAGKTSLLNCINGFYRPDSGSVSFKGKDITGGRARGMAQGRHLRSCRPRGGGQDLSGR
jgi:branched-chain amino acid transport system ATP-binding protein